MKSRLFIISFLVTLMLAIVGSYARAQWNPPEQITFNSKDELTTTGSLAIDGNDILHMAWAQYDGMGSSKQIVYKEGSSGNWGDIVEITPGSLDCTTPNLAVHPNGYSHLVWLQDYGDAGEIFYATNSSGTWITGQITNNTTTDIGPVVAVDGANSPHIAWAGYDPASGEGKIFYGKRSGGIWKKEVLENSSLGDYWTGAYPKISVSPAGVVQITYRGGGYGYYHVHQATNATGDWTIQILYCTNLNDFSSSVRTDLNNTCYLAMSGDYGWGEPGEVYYRKSSDQGLTWTAAELASGYHGTSNPVLGVDGYGHSHIAWEEVSGSIYTGTIFYSTNQGGAWTTESVTGSSDYSSPSLVVDGSGRVHMIYLQEIHPQPSEIFYLTNAVSTVSADITCTPSSGTLPFSTFMTVTLDNLEPLRPASRVSARIDVLLANGSFVGAWQQGWRDVIFGAPYVAGWGQGIPALGFAIGNNIFTLHGQDVTPAPFNQPPYPPAGDTDSDVCTVTGIAP